MQDNNRLKLVLVEQKKGGIHYVNNIVEDTPANGYLRNWKLILQPFPSGVPILLNQILKQLRKLQSS